MVVKVWKNHKNRSIRYGSLGNMSKILRMIFDKNYVSTEMLVDNHEEFQDLVKFSRCGSR